MKPIANWQVVHRRAWSVKLIIAAAILSGLEIALTSLDGYLPVPQGSV